MTVSIDEAKKRFSEAAFTRADRYQTGTQGKGSKWAGSKDRAKANYAPAMQEVLSKKLFDTGLDKADAGSYEAGVRDKGVNNWGTGIQAGSEKFGKNVQKFASLWGQSLPTARGQRRSANNIKRMTENAQRFIDAAGK